MFKLLVTIIDIWATKNLPLTSVHGGIWLIDPSEHVICVGFIVDGVANLYSVSFGCCNMYMYMHVESQWPQTSTYIYDRSNERGS